MSPPYIYKKQFVTVKISFGWDFKIGVDSGPISPNNKFIERGRKR